MKWIWQKADWPNFFWEAESLLPFLSKARFEQVKLLARSQGLGFELGQEARAEILSEKVIKNSEIEGENLNSGELEKKAILQSPSKGRSTCYQLNWNILKE